jgi:hypothetical protein
MSWPDWMAVSVYVVPATGEVLTFEYVTSVVPRYSLPCAACHRDSGLHYAG